MSENRLETLEPSAFWQLMQIRKCKIEAAPETADKSVNAPNALAEALHPKVQYMQISAVTENGGAKTYRLVPDKEKGSAECAYFQAGQYISVQVCIDGRFTSRPYSLTSSPRDALCGFYEITVKLVAGGAVSEYILSHWKVGTKVTISAPMGQFTYEPLRDAEHIVGIAGGSGVTPFVSLAKAIADGDESCSMTLLYGSRKKEDTPFYRELSSIVEKTDRVRVVYIFSDEVCENAESGFISAALIKRYLPQTPYSVFLCGPEQMIRFVDRELESLNIESRRIRHETQGEAIDPARFREYPETKEKTVQVTVYNGCREKVMEGTTRESVLRILERNGVAAPTGCRSGECGFCRSRLISGNVFIPKSMDKRRQADLLYGYIHPCCTYPDGDLKIEIFAACAERERKTEQ